MREYKINILSSAAEDIINIRADIIRKYNDIYDADKITNMIFDKLNGLANFPKRAEIKLIVSELELRFLKMGKYTAVYYVDDLKGVVKIYGVFHSRRNFEKIVEDRF